MPTAPPFESPLGRAAALITNPALPAEAMLRIPRAVPGAPRGRATTQALCAALAADEDPVLRTLLGRAVGVTRAQRALLVETVKYALRNPYLPRTTSSRPRRRDG